MAVKIRLARKGRKKLAFYHIVVADSRSPRDGRFIERLGLYDPNSNPATIELDFDRSLEWLKKGAQPTDTCRAILSYKGVMLKKHLLEGVKKGAFDEAEAERRFNEWMADKQKRIDGKRASIQSAEEQSRRERIDAEKLISDTRAAEIAKRNAELAEEEAAAAAEPAEESAETTATEAPKDEPAAEAPADEAPAAEPAEESAETTAAEAPKEEPKAEPSPEESATEPTPEEPASEAKAEPASEEAGEAEADSEAKAKEEKGADAEPKEEKGADAADNTGDGDEEKPAS